MLSVQELVPLGPKTTMRIGGSARWYAELQSKKDCEEAYALARAKKCPLIVLGGGSNTIFADGTIEALVVRILADNFHVMPSSAADPSIHSSPSGTRSTRDDTAGHIEAGERQSAYAEAGKNLAQLVNELAERNLDLSPLTGIPGTVGGAVFGNAGQGFGDIWVDRYVERVEAYVDGSWRTFGKSEITFRYRWSSFKEMGSPIIWSVTLSVPSRPKAEIQAETQRLLKKRIETQPHVKTAGSCFLSVSKEQPAWKLIDAAGLRGKKMGSVSTSGKHANFLIAEKGATFNDAIVLVEHVRDAVGAQRAAPLQVEMRFINSDGTLAF